MQALALAGLVLACVVGHAFSAPEGGSAERVLGQGEGKGAAGHQTKNPLDEVMPDVPQWTVERYAGPDLAKNVTALCFDEEGNVYVTETYRWRQGVHDNRNQRYWLMDDMRAETVEDRVAYHLKWEAEKLGPGFFTQASERVMKLKDTDGDGVADEAVVFADGFNAVEDGPAIGLIEGDGKVYMTSIPHLWLLEDTTGDGRADVKEPVASGFGVKTSLSGHDLHGLAWGMDGKLYFSLGDRGFNVTTEEGGQLVDVNSGAVFRCNPDGADLEVFYHQLRNPQELAFNEFGDLFTVDNNCDQGDEARVVYVIEGGDAGWTMGTQHLTTFKDDIEDGGLGVEPFWMSEELWKPAQEGHPEWFLPALANFTDGPSGLVFNSGHNLPERYRNHFLVCDYQGTAAQCDLYSFQVKRSGGGYVTEDEHKFFTGVANPDVDLGYDGRFYLADFGGGWVTSDQGGVYTLSHPETLEGNAVVAEVARLFAEGFEGLDVDSLGELLGHEDIRVRRRAQFELVDRGERGFAVLKRRAGDESNQLARLHAIWGLGQLGAGDLILEWADDADAEVRAQVAKTSGNLRNPGAVPALVELLRDESARVRTFAGIALGKVGTSSQIPAVAAMLEANDDEDLYVRHGGVMALAGLGDGSELSALSQHTSRSVRLGALLALRYQRSGEIAAFLDDEDILIVEEAVRAINDTPIPDAWDALAVASAGIVSRGVPSETIYVRLLNANLRSDLEESAVRLAALANMKSLPESYRVQALDFLKHWAAPPPVDPTMGVYRPVPEREIGSLKEALAGAMEDVFGRARGEWLAAALDVAGSLDISVPREMLYEWLEDDYRSVPARVAAIEWLAESPDGRLVEVLPRLAEAKQARLAAAATLVLSRLKPDAAPELIGALVGRNNVYAKRVALELMAESQNPSVLQLLAEQIGKLVEGKLPPQVGLDVFLAAERQATHKLVAAKFQELQKAYSERKSGIFELTIAGGDEQAGRRVFDNQGTCRKCHRTEGSGGRAGPELAGVALRLPPAQLLESILYPNNVIVPGYGICSVTLKDGEMVAGSLLEEDVEKVVIKVPEGGRRRVNVEDIEIRTPVMSSMPPMGLALSKTDLRDLMAYMAKQRDGEDEAKGGDGAEHGREK
ncbi:MAG: PVC-type heme-binding CxxCH protein [Verrucomicrobiota bacterium]